MFANVDPPPPPPLLTRRPGLIWLFAIGYFCGYVPFSALTKAVSNGDISGVAAVDGIALLPGNAVASVCGVILFMTVSGWWRYAHLMRVGPFWLPRPTLWTFLSGLCTAAITVTTLLAYTFEGVSILFMMLLMRGGVLVLAPVVDLLTGRRPGWPAWTALGLSLVGVLLPLAEAKSYALGKWAAIDFGIYILAYFLRFRLMSRFGKLDAQAGRRYFVEEQICSQVTILILAIIVGSLQVGSLGETLHEGFGLLLQPATAALIFGIGALNQITGTFGSLVLLDGREHTFCVPVNRAASVLAGVAATSLLWLVARGSAPHLAELVGATLVVTAIGVLAAPGILAAAKPPQSP